MMRTVTAYYIPFSHRIRQPMPKPIIADVPLTDLEYEIIKSYQLVASGSHDEQYVSRDHNARVDTLFVIKPGAQS